MELSLSPSSSARLPTIRPWQSSISSCRTKIKIKVTGKSIAILAKSSQILRSTELHRHKSCSKLFTRDEYTRGNAIRVLVSTHVEGDGSDLEPEKTKNFLDGQVSSQIVADVSDLKPEKTKNFLDALWRFMRPFVVRGAITGYTTVVARTWMEHPQPLKWSQILKASAGLFALLCCNGFAGGINQVFDVEIDKINKPYLPIPAGDLSLESAWLLLINFVAIGVSIAGALNSTPFAACVQFLLFIGIAYSVPPIRLKRSTAGAILAIALLQGVLVLASSSVASASLGLPFVLSYPVTFFSIFSILFGAAIAIVKDLHDLEGDRKFNIPTLATIIGARSIAFIGSGIILLNYIGAILTAILMPQIFRRSVVIPAHTIMAIFLIYKTWKLDKTNYKKEESEDFYQFLWKLMYVEYVLFPFI